MAEQEITINQLRAELDRATAQSAAVTPSGVLLPSPPQQYACGALHTPATMATSHLHHQQQQYCYSHPHQCQWSNGGCCAHLYHQRRRRRHRRRDSYSVGGASFSESDVDSDSPHRDLLKEERPSRRDVVRRRRGKAAAAQQSSRAATGELDSEPLSPTPSRPAAAATAFSSGTRHGTVSDVATPPPTAAAISALPSTAAAATAVDSDLAAADSILSQISGLMDFNLGVEKVNCRHAYA